MDSGRTAINPRANYKQALEIAGIRGAGKQGGGKSALDFYDALGLNQSDPGKDRQDNEVVNNFQDDRDTELSNADTNYTVNKPKESRKQDTNIWNIRTIGGVQQ